MNALAMGSRFPLSGARGSRRWLALLLGLFLALASTLDAIPTRSAAGYLELGLTTEHTEGTEVSWKVYGPDMSGAYGGLQGLGGLEAVIGSDGVTRGMVSDWFGNTVGHIAAPGGAMSWSGAQFLAWGAAPGWGTPPLDGTKPMHELLGYRGLTVDPTGYVQQGLRAYDPQVGRWLSPDPVGHAGSLSLYDYCDNDPLNVFDPDGRFGKGVGGGAVKGDYYKPTNFAQGLGQFVGQVGAGFTPVGILGDVRDFTAAVGTVRNEGLNWRTGSGVVMGMAAFVPGFGDAAKGIAKPLLSAAPASPTIQAASTVGSVASGQAARAGGQGPVVIGETMKRVTDFATDIPGAKILNDMPNFQAMGMNADQVTSAMMQYNRKWILEQMRSGRQIIDIGADATRANPSIFYQMEQNMLKNYQKLHPEFSGAVSP